ncbi:MAG: disulfide bond formation protein DsbA [Alteromonadaceae bacterium]|jgi:thiol:disulfide interchange protein DsbA|nr:disulfide bond formation protein DsbA [Alteromonadaceae bacterium]MDA0892140.1 thiol:disulfide interchange protein DsbA/DsbL [Pseudomonadota bacterium]RCL48155.1 MAG: thiol:disulfide interchange protein DsbA/DsbL [Halieaceae bacterium]RPH09420.1 MAG: thiol:disulfide interchange protein DsbA/DsbL [Alteromonadaceae bacterium TMED101]|tara:strand:- start:3 stop:665 length:663 start_codon:yes stop_codon:yes gene_type:complete
MLTLLRALTAAVVFMSSVGVVAQEQYEEGVHYELIEPAIHTGVSDRVVVTEFFSYGCGHCYNFEPLLESFDARLPDGVMLQRTPVIWNNNPGMKLLAKTYYAVEVLDVFEPVHGAVFNAIHRQRKRLSSPEAVKAVFVENGVSDSDFDRAFGSFGIDSMVRQAAARTEGARINGTPSLMVNGKYRIDTRQAGSQANMLKIAAFLADKELARLAGAAGAAD